MDFGKIINQAKFLYPVGTECLSTCRPNNAELIVGSKPEFLEHKYIDRPYNVIWNKGLDGMKFGFLWDDQLGKGRWAEVISRPKEYIKINNNGLTCSHHPLGEKYEDFEHGSGIYKCKTYEVVDRILADGQMLLVLSNGNQIWLYEVSRFITSYHDNTYFTKSSRTEYLRDWEGKSCDLTIQII